MSRCFSLRQVLLLIVIVMMVCPASRARGLRGDEGSHGIRVGIISSGTVNINGRTYDQDAGVSLGLFYDVQALDNLYWGVNVDLHRMAWTLELIEIDRTLVLREAKLLTEITAGFKYRFAIDDGLFAFRPTAAIGVGYLPRMLDLQASTYLVLKTGGELLWYPAENYGLILEVGMFYAPSGHADVNSVTIDPLLLVRAGVAF